MEEKKIQGRRKIKTKKYMSRNKKSEDAKIWRDIIKRFRWGRKK